MFPMWPALADYLKRRPEYTLDRHTFLSENRTIIRAGAVLFLSALLIRSWENFSHPGFYVEDASYYFKLNYGADFKFVHIFRNPNGYYNVFNNFITQVLSLIDIRWQAYAYQAVATTISATTVIMFSRSGLIRNRALLLVTPLVLGLSGLNHLHYYTTITFQMYLLVITLFLALLWEKQDSFVKNIVIFLMIPVLVWSGPYSVLAAPFALLFILLFRGKDAIMLWTIIVATAYTCTTTGKTGSSIIPRHLIEGHYLQLWFETLVRDIFFMGFQGAPNIEKTLLLVIILGAAIYCIRRDTFTLRILALLMLVIVSTPAPLFLTNKYKLYQGVFPCHLLTANIAWILFVLLLLDRILPRMPSGLRPTADGLVVVLIIFFVISDNLKHEYKWRIEVLYNTKKFLHTIKQYEQMNLKEKNQKVVVWAEGYQIFAVIATVGSRSPEAKKVKGIYIPRTTDTH